MESPNKLCAFCDNFQKYICPKCRKAYCSLNCYKSEQHLECTENFYKDQVFEVLKQNYVDINDRKTMLEILKRVESAQPTETPNEDADIILEEKLENLNLEEDIDENELWNCLTEKGKQDFKRNIKMQTIGSYIKLWEPWWHIPPPLVEDVSKPVKSAYPSIETNIVPFSKITQKPPHDFLKYNLLNILMGYSFIAIYYNGDYFELAEDAFNCFLYLCPIFTENKVFSSAEEAISQTLSLLTAEDSEWKVKREDALEYTKEITKILQGPTESHPVDHILLALSDLKALVKISKKQCKAKNLNMVAIKKKLEFYLSWTKDYGKSARLLIPTDDNLHSWLLFRMIIFIHGFIKIMLFIYGFFSAW
ncbi:ZNHIT2 [Cordylochernes scorpioides]|uniref:ZNHIT2 n=1 Tax=Cordylochernes scorpioides TaxID=51811 RepID=A0ABY6KGM4_9ARAC|nr:ZNHIT2 [Cordylochernes scorpioides]